MFLIENLTALCVCILVVAGFLLAIDAVIEDNNDFTRRIGIVFIVTLGVLFILGLVYEETVQERDQKLNECVWMLENAETYLLFGTPKNR